MVSAARRAAQPPHGAQGARAAKPPPARRPGRGEGEPGRRRERRATPGEGQGRPPPQGGRRAPQGGPSASSREAPGGASRRGRSRGRAHRRSGGPPGEPRSRATRRAPAPIGRASERGTKRAVPRRGRRSPDGAGARPPKGRAASRTGRGGWGPGVPLKFAAGLRRQTAGTGWGRGAGPRIGRSPLRGAPSAPGTRGRAPPGCGAAAPQSERSEQVRQQPDRGRPKGGPLLDKRTLFHQQTLL